MRLIAVTIGVSLLIEFGGAAAADIAFRYLVFIPARFGVENGFFVNPMSTVLPMIGHAFLHGGITHLLINMAFLLAFGSAVARRMGAVQFLLLYLSGAAAGAVAFYFANPETVGGLVGASGAVSACVGAITQAALLPRPGMPPPPRPFNNGRTALIFIGVFIGLNLLINIIPGPDGGSRVAGEAHLGGFAAGFILMLLLDGRGLRHPTH